MVQDTQCGTRTPECRHKQNSSERILYKGSGGIMSVISKIPNNGDNDKMLYIANC